jgi:K+-transporting ATPase A subunit
MISVASPKRCPSMLILIYWKLSAALTRCIIRNEMQFRSRVSVIGWSLMIIFFVCVGERDRRGASDMRTYSVYVKLIWHKIKDLHCRHFCYFLFTYKQHSCPFCRAFYNFHSCTVRLDIIVSFIYPTDAQLDGSKTMLQYTWEVLLHVSVFHSHHQGTTKCALLKL